MSTVTCHCSECCLCDDFMLNPDQKNHCSTLCENITQHPHTFIARNRRKFKRMCKSYLAISSPMRIRVVVREATFVRLQRANFVRANAFVRALQRTELRAAKSNAARERKHSRANVSLQSFERCNDFMHVFQTFLRNHFCAGTVVEHFDRHPTGIV